MFISKNIKVKKLFDVYEEVKEVNENITMFHYNESFFNLSYVSKLEKGEYFRDNNWYNKGNSRTPKLKKYKPHTIPKYNLYSMKLSNK